MQELSDKTNHPHNTVITLTKPDDAHVHFRDEEYLANTVLATARCFARAVVMPNLQPPVTTLQAVVAYRERILAHVPGHPLFEKKHVSSLLVGEAASMAEEGYLFEPLMTLYLTDTMSLDLVAEARKSGVVLGFKLYPKGATTHSDAGVSSLKAIYPLLAALQEHDLPLLVHGESIDPTVDVFDREKVFLDALWEIIRHFPQLRIVLEHITTHEAVDFVLSAPPTIAATITVHHLLLNRNDLFSGGIRPHYYCLPILKRERDQHALIRAATSGSPKFFLGTDSAPHAIAKKESACGCAGIYSAPAALELYAEVFEQAGCLDKLEAFASFYAADFYRLPRNTSQVTLIKKPWQVPLRVPFGDSVVLPLRGGEAVAWQLSD